MIDRLANRIATEGPPKEEGLRRYHEGKRKDANANSANSLSQPRKSTKLKMSAIKRKLGHSEAPFLAFLMPSAAA